MSDAIEIVDNVEAGRYEARIESKLAGFAAYQLTPTLVVFTHTEVLPAFEGRGVGSALARFGLERTRDEGQSTVLPLCPFVKSWIARHPEFVPLVFGQPASTAKD